MLLTLDAGASPLAPSASHILTASSRTHHWSGTGALSIKSFRGGRAIYDVGRGRYRVDEDQYLLLNHRQEYAINIDQRSPVDSFCVFFAEGLVEDVARVMQAGHAELLDHDGTPSTMGFVERTHARSGLVGIRLGAIEREVRAGERDRVRLSSLTHGLARALLHEHTEVRREMDALHAVRASTREEIYRRLHRAREWMRASLSSRISLRDMARVACMSENHFLRTFRQAFHQSPHAYLTRCRMEEAVRLLSSTRLDVTEVCARVGFESVSSFSRLFRRHHGMAPGAMKKVIPDKRGHSGPG